MPTRVTISGNNFFAISDVLFGANSATNWDVNAARNTIVAEVPSGVTYDTIKVISALRQKTGTSPYKFAPTPTVDGYWGTSRLGIFSDGYRVSGAFVPSGSIVVYGKNFSGVTGVYINNINCNILNYIEPNSQIEVLLASGQLNSFIRLRGYSGINKVSSFSFEPQVYISGLSGDVNGYFVTGRLIHVSGRFFIPQTLSQYDPDVYSLKIGNGARFNAYIKNPYALTGIVPAGAVDGVVQTQTITEKWNGNPNVIARIAKTPQVIGLYGSDATSNSSWYYPETGFATGINLDFVTGVLQRHSQFLGDLNSIEWYPFSGWSVSNKRVLLPGTGIPLGWYDYMTGNSIENDDVDFAFLYRYGSGLMQAAEETVGGPIRSLNLSLARETSKKYISQHPIYFSGSASNGSFGITMGQNGFISGSGILQRRGAFFNTPVNGVRVEYSFSGISGWNWYATGGNFTGFSQRDLLGYGLPRLYSSATAESITLALGISGVRNSNGSYIFNTGIYYFPYEMRGSDGFATGFTGRVYISTGRYI